MGGVECYDATKACPKVLSEEGMTALRLKVRRIKQVLTEKGMPCLKNREKASVAPAQWAGGKLEMQPALDCAGLHKLKEKQKQNVT